MRKNSTPSACQRAMAACVLPTGKSDRVMMKATIFLVASILSFGKISAQYSGTISVPNASFANLGVLVDSLNQYGLSGNLTVNVTAAQTAPTDGYNLGSTALNNSMTGKTLVFNGGGNVITAQVGTRSTTSTLAGTGAIDFIWSIRGTDNVTINNFVFTDPTANNASAVSAMEAAIACFNMGSAVTTADGCQNIFITNNTFNLHNIATYSNCVWVTPFVRWTTTIANWGAPEDQHRNINITGNTMNEGYNFCMVRGSTNLDYNLPVVRINNNTVLRQGGGAVACYGVGTYYVDSLYMNNNVVVQDTLQSTTSYQLYPYFYGAYGEVRNNNVTLSKGNVSIANYGIYNYFYHRRSDVQNGSRYYVVGNTINWKANLSVLPTTGGSDYGIYNYMYTLNAGDNLNKLSTGFIDSNNIVNDTIAGSVTFYGYYLTSSGNPNAFSLRARGNRIENVLRTGSGNPSYGFYIFGFSDSSILENNIIRNFVYTPAASVTGTATFYGIGGYYSIAGAKPHIRGNIIENCGVNGLYTSTSNAIYGIGFNSTTNLCDIYNNRIHNLYVRSTTTGGGNVYGIFNNTAVSSVNIYNNVLDSFIVTTTSTGTTGGTAGIYNTSGSGTWNIYNNYIGDLFSPAASSTISMHGIFSSSTPNMNIFNNTIRIGRTGAVTSSSTGFGGSGIYYPNSTTSFFVVKNNIIDINATPGTAGSFACIRRASGTHGTKPVNYSGNNNTFNINALARNYHYCEGTGSAPVNGYTEWAAGGSFTNDANFDGPCSAYKGFMQGEAFTASNSETWAVGPIPNTSRPSGASMCEGSAEPLGMVVTDLIGNSRGASPDRGALQFTGTATDIFGPSISYVDIPQLFCTTTATLTADITDNSGINVTSGTRPRVYYKKSTEANTFGLANNSSTNGWKWVEATNTSSPFIFNLDYSLLNSAVTTGNTINYFVIAQDVVGTPNVGTNTVSFTGGCPTSVVIPGSLTASGFKSYAINTTTPPYTIEYTPPTSCMYDTLQLRVLIDSSAALMPTYAALGTANVTTTGWGDIDTFILNGGANISGCASASGPTPGGAGNGLPASISDRHSNYVTSSLGNLTELIAGTSVGFRASCNSGGTTCCSVASTFGIYIDYNRNGVLESPGELVYVSNYTQNLVTTATCVPGVNLFSGTINVPSTIVPGPTLCRVMALYSFTSTTPAPTASVSYGEVEDYQIMLKVQPNPAITQHAWYTNKTGASILGTANPIRLPSYDTTTIFRDTINVAGCKLGISKSVTVNPAPRKLATFNASQCGPGVPPSSFKVRDSNGFTFPIIAWYGSPAGGSPLQIGLDTVYLNPVNTTTTMYVAIQDPSSGCWSARSTIILTVTASDSILGRANGIRDTIRVCQGIPLNLTAVNVQLGGATKSFDTFIWSGSAPGVSFPLKNTTGTQTINITAGGNYLLFVDAKDTGTNCTARDTVAVIMQHNPFGNGQAFLTATPNPACAGTNITHSLFMANSLATMPTYTLGAAAGPNTAGYQNIDTFQLGSFLNTSGCVGGGGGAANGLPASITNKYSNYTGPTGPGVTTSLSAGTAVPFNVVMGNFTTTWSGWGTAVSIFIDYNRNGTIEVPAERAYMTAPSSFMTSSTATTCNASPKLSGTINVPGNIVSGPALCRVIAALYTSSTSGQVTSPNTNPGTWGETEDYIVNLVGAADTNTTKLSWKSSNTGATVLGTDKTLVHPVSVNNQVYTVRMTNGLCIDSLKDTISTTVPPLTLNTINGSTSVCSGETIKLTVTSSGGCIPHTYSWFMVSGTGTVTPLGTGNLRDSVNFTPTGATGARTIRCVVTANDGTKDSVVHVVSFNNPTPSAVVKDTICGLNSATLCATSSVSSDILRWFSSPTSFNELAEGNCYTTPALNQETVFYVRQFTSVIDSCEPRSTMASFFQVASATYLSGNYGSRVRATKRVIIRSVDIVPDAAGASVSSPVSGTINVGVYDQSGNLIGSSGVRTISIVNSNSATSTATPVTIPLGVLVNPGDYDVRVISSTGIANLDYAQIAGGAVFQPQWTASGSFGVWLGLYGGTTYNQYNFMFWNYKVEEGCWGAATPDTVKYVTPPAITLSRKNDSVCSGSATTIPVTLTAPSPLSTYNSYQWTPSANVAGDSASGYMFSEPTVSTLKYVLKGTQTSGLQCATTDTFTLLVKPIPSAFNINPAGPLSLCNGTIQSLDASSFRLNTAILGTGTTSGTAAGQTPLMGGWGGTKAQYIIRASELTALGLTPPSTLKSIGMTATTSGATYEGVQIWIGPSALNAYAVHTNQDTSTLTKVYEATGGTVASYTPTIGLNQFVFGTGSAAPIGSAVSDKYVWSGGDIVIVFSHSENPLAANVAASSFVFTTLGFNANCNRQTDNMTMAQMLSGTAGGTTTTSVSANRPNMILGFQDKLPMAWSPTSGLYINAATTTSYTGTNRDTVWSRHNDTIKYFATATHPNGCTLKDSIVLNVKDSITIVQQPSSFSAFCQGDTIKVSINATSTSPITYQWKKNGLNISTALNSSAGTNQLVIPNSTQADSGVYEVDLTTGAPCSVKTSILATVKVRRPITITTQPKDTSVCVGSPMAVIAAALNDSARRWTQIGGANTGTNNVYSSGSTVYADSGRYFITYYPNSPCPAKNSDTVTVNVLPPAMILTDPVTLTNLCVGDSVKLKATHQGALGFQWLKNGVPIAGATKDSLTVKGNTLADSGTYQLVVMAAVGCTPDTSSATAGIVKVKLPVSIVSQPLAKTFVCQNSPFNASVTANNTTGYQWEKDATPIFSATNASFTIPSTQPSDAGVFRVLVKGIAPCPDVYSTNDTLQVTTLAAMTVQPTAFQVCESQSISITGTASNAVSYQWLLNGSPISAPNGTAQTYTKGGSPAAMADSGIYRLVALSANAGATVCKADTSAAVLGAVVRKIAITTQPLANTFVCQNSPFNTSIVAQNVTSYQWKKGGVNVSIGTGGTTANYSIASAQPSDNGVYTVEMTGITPCPNVTSTNNTLQVTTLAAMTTQPTSFQVCEDQSISITGAASNAASYRWLFNGSPIAAPNGTAQTYTKGGSPAVMADSGRYRLVALSANAGATTCKADTSNEVLGAVVRKIAITTQPLANTFVCQNSPFNTSIAAQNVTGYQWKKGGVNVSTGSGGTTANYSISSTQPSNAGAYTVEMTGITPCPNVTSTTNNLAVTTLAAITTPPASGTVVCENQSFTLNTAATNAAGYQWMRNGTNVGTNSTSYGIGSATMSDSAFYRVVALSNNAGATVCKADTSAPVLVAVNRAINITTQPAAFSYGCIGASFNLNVVAQNATGYSWRKNGTPNGQTSSTMTLNPFGYPDTGNYTVVITGRTSCPSVTSNNAKVDPTTAAFVTVEPVNTDVCLNGTLNLSVTAQAAQSYQWRKNGVNIAGATSNTYSIPNVGYGVAANYDVIAVAYFGCTNDTSVNASVTISTPLSITTPLANTDVKCEGQSISYNIAVSGTSPYTYNWKLNGSTVGTNNSNYSKTGVMTSDSGKYVVSILGSPACPMVYDTIDLDVNRTPVVTVEPNGASPICLGSTSTLNATVKDEAVIEWHKVGGGNTGQTGTTFNIAGATNADAGTYYVIAKGQTACSDVTSNQFSLAINAPATVALQPVGAAILEDPAGNYTMNIIASGTGPFTYQWYRQNNPILGATNSSYAITNYVPALDSGSYYCKVTAPAPCSNSVNSNVARITTIKCPAIVDQPAKTINICAGAAFSLDVTATGVKNYQWFKGNTPIAGATFANFSIPNADPSHSGIYRCRLFAYNDATCDITYTDSAVVVVKDQPIITKQPAGISSCAVSNHEMTVEATYGETYQWYRNGIAISPGGDGPSYTYNNVNLIGDEFYVVVGNKLCPDATSNKVVLKNVNPSSQVYLTGSTVFNLVERCEDANGWTYYSTSAQSEQLLMAIKKNGNSFTAKPDIELMGSIREISPINKENRGALIGSVIFNLDIQGSVVNPYELKFFYSKADADLIMNRFTQIRTANSGNFSTDRTDLSFILSTQRAFNSALWNNMTIPVNFEHTILHKDKEFGVENNVNFVVLKQLVSPKLGGTMFMDYKLKSSSSINSTNPSGFGFSMYPVPSTDGKVTVDVNSKKLKPITFTVLDMTGRVVAVFNEKHTSMESSHAFDFSQLSNGNYQMMMSNDEESAVGKFTISK